MRFTNTGRGSSGVTLLGSTRDFAIYTGNPSVLPKGVGEGLIYLDLHPFLITLILSA